MTNYVYALWHIDLFGDVLDCSSHFPRSSQEREIRELCGHTVSAPHDYNGGDLNVSNILDCEVNI